jgi:hypothetical protein
MKGIDRGEKVRGWIVDYSAARIRAIEWLGDRYLLANPVNRVTRSDIQKAANSIQEAKASGRG